MEQLSLACRGLAICSSCLPWGPSALNLVYTAASSITHERLDLTAELTSKFDSKIQTIVWNARLTLGGAPAPEFEKRLFEDKFVDGDLMSESSSLDSYLF